MEFSWNHNIKCTEKYQSSIFTHPFLMSPLFQKYLNPQVRTNKLVNSIVYHPCPSRLYSHGYILSSFFKILRVLSLSRMLVYSTIYGKIFSIYGVHIPRKCIESMHFYSCPSPHSKLQVEVFEKLFPPRQNGWRELWFASSKLVVYLYFVWFTIFLNVMALQFCE